MAKIAKNKSSTSSRNSRKKKGETEKKGKKKQSLVNNITEEEYNELKRLQIEKYKEEEREIYLRTMEVLARRKKVEEEEFKKRLIALGYVFIPTEGKLVDYYLRNKNVCISMDHCPIEEVDVYANHPQALAEKHPNTAEVWYFFTRSRPNEIQAGHDVYGQWVICEKKDVFNQGEKVGVKLLLEYCEGGHKSEYKIIEYQLDPAPENLENGHWFICKLYNGGCVDVRFRP